MRARLFAAVLILTLAGCGGSDAPGEPGLLDQARQAGRAAQGMQEMAERLEANQDLPPAETVDFRRLRDLLPASVLGTERSSSEGSRQGVGEFAVATASARYDGEPGAEVTISDMGGNQAALAMGSMWALATIDRETDGGFERTVEIDGEPAFETYRTEARRGEIQTLVAGRFLVQVTATGVEADRLREALQSVDAAALRAMRDAGRPAS